MNQESINQVAQAFLQYYYQNFDGNRANLQGIYRNESKLFFEGQSFQGLQNIMQKLTTLGFRSIRHNVKTFDATNITGGLLVFVSGDVFVDDSPNPVKFA